MMVVVKRSDGGGGKRKAHVYLGCKQGGAHREWKGKRERFDTGVAKRVVVDGDRDSKSRKTDCPFLLKGEEIYMGGPWAYR